MDRILVLVGPTASGKTALSVALARRLGGEIISADSMQIYRNMDIGTAKVTPEEMDGVPHYMIDVCDPAEPFSAARFVELADPILQDILSRGKIAVIAGGTGLYVDSLIAGRSFAAYPTTGRREALEREADRLGMEHMLERLRAVDPDSAMRFHLKERKKIIRALEVYEETGKTITQHNRESAAIPDRYNPAWLGLAWDRAVLYDRVNRRVDRMLEQGLLTEICGLLEAGVPRTCTAMQAIGYKEFFPVLDGTCSLESAADTVRQESRRYAKRQLTWFRRNQKIHWLPCSPEQSLRELEQLALEQLPLADWQIPTDSI